MAAKKQQPIELISSEKDKAKALATTLEKIGKQFGQGSVMRLGENTHLNIGSIPTGSIGLDIALGVGGIPKGRIIELFGPESSGKTTVALHCVAEAQKRGGIAVYIDAEHALDPVYAKAIGVDVDELLVCQPDTGEQGLDIAEALVRSGAIDIVVVDSVAALTPRAEIEGEMGDAFVGLHARMMSQAMRKLAGSISKSECAAIFINQLRENIHAASFANRPTEATTGGRALKFYASVRIDVRRAEHIKNGTTMIGSHTRVKVVKMHTPLQESSKTADDGASAPREWCGCSGCMVHSGRRHGAHGRRAFPLFGNTFALAHGFTLDLDGVGVVDDPVTDGVGQGGVVQVLVPLAGVVLGAEDGGGHLAPGLY